ncbi:hypothetical protein 2 [Hubei sobemo-like virus 27]|uniref:hypothetical protein 2 n=1 Tax=Hubei sobemo-like virus 27 TaxID=1923213 RepID=UPI00090CCBEB|nr:hypothetical protein 2 [Hubei sobemo-like virus 27]APG75923.1 hypothetical protein 2 [Hubei sobemo-like virus 27]
MQTAVAKHEAARWDIPDDFLEETHFLRAVEEVDYKSSPGYPYMVRNPSNSDFFGVVDGVANPARLKEIWEIVQIRLHKLLLGEDDCDYIRLFIKAEPIKEKKLRDHKYRLISSVSVIDQIIDHMLFDPMNHRLYDNWHMVPSKVGWSPYKGGWRIFPTQPLLAIDKSSWDWTVCGWLIEQIVQFRIMLCNNINDSWIKLATQRYKCLFLNPLFLTSGGLVLKQKEAGVMKSGCVNTIADNSIMQLLLHLRVSLERGGDVDGLFYTMGDDTVQDEPNDLDDYLSRLNQFSIVKQATNRTEFAGMHFNYSQVEPMYGGKHAFNLLHLDPENEEQVCSSYMLLYHRSKFRGWFESLFEAMNIPVPHRLVRDHIFDNS